MAGRYQGNIIDTSGQAIEDATITATLVSTGAAATLYSDEALTTAITTLETDRNGYFTFYAPDGVYDVVATYLSGTQTQTFRDVPIFDPDVVISSAQLAGVDKIYSTKAEANADIDNRAADDIVMIVADETYSDAPRSVYKVTGSPLDYSLIARIDKAVNAETVAAMKALDKPADGSTIYILSEQRRFKWDASSTEAEIADFIEAADAGGIGRWIAQAEGTYKTKAEMAADPGISTGAIVSTQSYTSDGIGGARYKAVAQGGSTDEVDLVAGNGVDYERVQPRSTARDVLALSAPAVSVADLTGSCMLEKLRTTTYTEFAAYTPMTSDGKWWHRWLFTNRFNVTNDGAPRMINCSLAALYASTTTTRLAANNVSETQGQAATVTKTSSDGVTVGTWTGPATVLTTTDVIYSSTVGDTITWTITGVERIHLRGLWAGNGGIGKVTITESAVEIPEANYMIPSDHLVNFISTATGNTTMHMPLAEGLSTGSTYTVVVEVDSSNPVGNRVYTAGLLGYAEIAYDSTGIHGTILNTTLDSQSTESNFVPGTTLVYQFTDATKIDWKYVATSTNGNAQFTVYDSGGSEIASYDNQAVDTYESGPVSRKVTVASGLTKGTYYLHVKAGKTKNASATDYRFYGLGAIHYDETTAGTVGTDTFDDHDVPKNVQDPNNGSEYMLIGSGNLELAIDVRKTTEAAGDEEFVGGIHGYETTPTPVFYADGAVIDYAGGAQYDTWIADEFRITFSTTLKFPVDSSSFCTADYDLSLSRAGYLVKTTKTTLADSVIHDDFSIMLNCPSTDASNQGLSVGGGFENLCADQNYVLDSYDNTGTFIEADQHSVAFTNDSFSVVCAYVTKPSIPNAFLFPPYDVGNDQSLAQDRTDRTMKFYTRAFSGDDSAGVEVSSGTTWSHTKLYRVLKGNHKALFGVLG